MESFDKFPTDIITINDGSKNEDNKKRSLGSYVTKVFKESTIGVVASIASSHSNTSKVLKALVLIICLTGFLYQSIQFLLVVFSYPTSVDVEISRPSTFSVPAYTFCNNNLMKRSTFCHLYPDNCFEPTEEFCSHFYSYCGKNKTLVPKKEFYNPMLVMTPSEILEHADNLSYFMRKNENNFEDLPKGPLIRYADDYTYPMTCYSLHDVVTSSEIPFKKTKDDIVAFKSPTDSFEFYLEEDEMFIPGNRPGILFEIHSPYEAANPFNKGFFMKPGRSYKIFVKTVEEHLLEDPYRTNCTDYVELWEKNNHTGPRIQSMCEQGCLLEFSVKCFNCVLPMIMLPSESKFCEPTDYLVGLSCMEHELPTFELCYKSCKDDCRLTQYTTNVMENFRVQYEEDGEVLKDYSRYIFVQIYLEEDELIALKHSPKYMTVEVFSAIGGFIGCWLGISLLDIVDVVGSIFRISRYACKTCGR